MARLRRRRERVRHDAFRGVALRRRVYVVDALAKCAEEKSLRCLTTASDGVQVRTRRFATPSFCRARRTDNSICSRSRAASAVLISPTFSNTQPVSISGANGQSSKRNRQKNHTNFRNYKDFAASPSLSRNDQPTRRTTPTKIVYKVNKQSTSPDLRSSKESVSRNCCIHIPKDQRDFLAVAL